MTKTIVIAGANSWLGQKLIPVLKSKHHAVIALVRKASSVGAATV